MPVGGANCSLCLDRLLFDRRCIRRISRHLPLGYSQWYLGLLQKELRWAAMLEGAFCAIVGSGGKLDPIPHSLEYPWLGL